MTWRKIVAASALVLFAGTIDVPAQTLPPEIEADRLILKAKKKLDNKDFHGAVKIYERILRLGVQPEKLDFYWHYGNALFEIGRLKQAKSLLATYVRQAGRTARFYRRALEQLNDIEDRLAEIEKKRKADEAERERQRQQQLEERRKAELKAKKQAELQSRLQTVRNDLKGWVLRNFPAARTPVKFNSTRGWRQRARSGNAGYKESRSVTIVANNCTFSFVFQHTKVYDRGAVSTKREWRQIESKASGSPQSFNIEVEEAPSSWKKVSRKHLLRYIRISAWNDREIIDEKKTSFGVGDLLRSGKRTRRKSRDSVSEVTELRTVRALDSLIALKAHYLFCLARSGPDSVFRSQLERPGWSANVINKGRAELQTLLGIRSRL